MPTIAAIIRAPPKELAPIASPWAFSKWRIDLIEPTHIGRGGTKCAIVTVDYFTKTTNFIWKLIICRFLGSLIHSN